MKLLRSGLVYLVCLLFLGCAACGSSPSSTESPAEVKTSSGSNFSADGKGGDDIPIRILHAGGACNGMTYLNAQEPFETYYAAGYRYFEYDLMLSADGRLIGTHGYEHLDIPDRPLLYSDFLALRLPGGLTPVNEDWLVETVCTHPDIHIVVDAKMDCTEGDVAVLARLEALEDIHGLDLSSVIIPEIFSIEMWEAAEASTSFDRYLFSHYKVYYTVDTMLEHFSSPKILGVAVPVWSDGDIADNLHRLKDAGKRIFVFTVTNEEEIAFARRVSADGIYVNE